MAIPGSKKTYTINIKYTTKYPHEIEQQNNAKYKPANFEMSNNSFSSPTSSSQTYSGMGKTKPILKAHPSDYQGFTFQMNDTGPTYCKTSNFNDTSFTNKSRFSDHSKQNRRVRLFLDGEQTSI